jgi:ribonuclease HII
LVLFDLDQDGDPSLLQTGIAGVDEAGRGPLAGPVAAAAVILDPHCPIAGLADSKTLGARRRESLADAIHGQARSVCIAYASVEEIDRLNILQASLLAMRRAIAGLDLTPASVLVDGNRSPGGSCPMQTVVKGDRRVAAISAASILAKVSRDRLMLDLHARHPDYGFDRHKGYPTQFHLEALKRWGVLPEHRRSFAPVRRFISTISTP